jgi:hypothetical protein
MKPRSVEATMSKAVERLRKFAEKRETQRRGRDTRPRGGEAEREQMEPRVERMAALCLRKAEGLAKATGMSFPVWLSNGFGATATSFRLRAGTYGALAARLAENGWDVKTSLRHEQCSFNYPTDREFENAHQPLLESVLNSVLEGLPGGPKALLHGASLDPSARASRGASLISVLWQALRRGLSELSVAPRPATQTASAAFAAKPAEAPREDQPRLPDTEDATPPDAESQDRVAARIQALQRGLSELSVAPRPAAQTASAAFAAKPAEAPGEDQPRLPDTEDATPLDAESQDRVAARIRERLRYAKELLGHAEER